MKKLLTAALLALMGLATWAAETPQVKTHLIRHPWHGLWTGMFLVQGPQGCILIDTAVKEAISTTLEPEMKKLGLPLSAIGLVINTHSHSDHVEGNAPLKARLPGLPFQKPRDGAEFAFGGATVRAIATPGHSPDSFCLLEPTTGALFTGDSLQGRGTSNIGVALFTDPDAYRKSIHKVRDLVKKGEVRSMYLGHDEPPSRNGYVPQEELLTFLAACEAAIDDYTAATRDLLQKNPKADYKAVRNHLLNTCGSTKNPGWPELSYHTARVMRAYVLKQMQQKK